MAIDLKSYPERINKYKAEQLDAGRGLNSSPTMLMRAEILLTYVSIDALICYCICEKLLKENSGEAFEEFRSGIYEYLSGPQRKKLILKILDISDNKIKEGLQWLADLRNAVAHWAKTDDKVFIKNGKNILEDIKLQIEYFEVADELMIYFINKLREISKYNLENKLITQREFDKFTNDIVAELSQTTQGILGVKSS